MMKRKTQSSKTKSSGVSWPWITSRCMFLYLILGLSTLLIVDYDKLTTGVKIRMLSYMNPQEFGYLLAFHEQRASFDKKKFEEYRYYYSQALEYVPNSPDIHSMLGYCLYQLGEKEKSIGHYQKTIALFPEFFIPYYNLGLIFYKTGNYDESRKYFEKAVGLNPLSTLKFFSRSQLIYGVLLSGSRQNEQQLLSQLKKAYGQAHILLILGLYQQGDYEGMLRSSKLALKSQAGKEKVFYLLAAIAAQELNDKEFAKILIQKGLAFREDAQINAYLQSAAKALEKGQDKQLKWEEGILVSEQDLQLRIY